MIHRQIFRIALSLAVIAGASAAHAKPAPTLFTAADVERIAPPLDHGCILGAAAKTATPDQKIEHCTAGIAAFEAIKAKSKSASERAGMDFLIATFDFARAGSYLKVDNVRSARVCASAERVFAQMVGIDATLFDTKMAESLIISRAAVSRSIVVCRSDFGTPAGAPAVLPE